VTPAPRIPSAAAAHIVIVNWNAGALLRKCLDSLARFGGDALAETVLVDNGSTDGSADVEIPGLPLAIDRTGENLGFARGSNRGATGARAAYLLFLNPDTELRAGTLAAVVDFMEREESAQIGICGIRLVGEDGTVQRHCARFPTWRSFVGHSLALTARLPRLFPPVTLDDFDHLSNRDVDHVIGAFYLIRRDLFEALGGFDERFFVYLEDLDLSRRAAASGWRCHYLADAVAFHKGGGTSDQVKAHRLFYSLRSRLLYALKHFSRPAAWAVIAATLLIEPFSRLALAAARRSSEEARATLAAYRMLSADLGAVLRTNRRLRR